MRITRTATSLLLMTILSVTLLAGKELTPQAPRHPAIDAVSEALDGIGIDTVQGNTASVPLGARPRLAVLKTFPAKATPVATRPWMQDFVSGRIGIIATVHRPAGGGVAVDAQSFLARWANAPSDQRIFLSFTRADAAHAQRVASTLEANGFITFVYLNDAGQTPHDPSVVGRLFNEAGHHLVLDTINARRSEGVWLEATLAKVTAGRDDYYIPVRDRDPPSSGGSLAFAGGSSGPRGGGAPSAPESHRYNAPHMSVEELRASPQVFKRAGGIMFGTPAKPVNGALRLSHPRYDRSAPDGARLLLDSSLGPMRLSGVPDAVLLPAITFVADDRAVVVNSQSPKGSPQCSVNPGRLRLIELHPAFVDTSIGEALVRADTMVWPALDPEDVDARGRRFFLPPEAADARTAVAELRKGYSGGRITNINDAEAPASFSTSNGEVHLSGRPRFEVLTDSPSGSVALLTTTSDRLTRDQNLLFAQFDPVAYNAVVQVYRTVGMLRHVQASDPAHWNDFAKTVPGVSRRARTPSIMCALCDSTKLFTWVANCERLIDD